MHLFNPCATCFDFRWDDAPHFVRVGAGKFACVHGTSSSERVDPSKLLLKCNFCPCSVFAYNYPSTTHNRIVKVRAPPTGATAMIQPAKSSVPRKHQQEAVPDISKPQSIRHLHRPDRTGRNVLQNQFSLKTNNLVEIFIHAPQKQRTYRPPFGQKQHFSAKNSRFSPKNKPFSRRRAKAPIPPPFSLFPVPCRGPRRLVFVAGVASPCFSNP